MHDIAFGHYCEVVDYYYYYYYDASSFYFLIFSTFWYFNFRLCKRTIIYIIRPPIYLMSNKACMNIVLQQSTVVSHRYSMMLQSKKRAADWELALSEGSQNMMYLGIIVRMNWLLFYFCFLIVEISKVDAGVMKTSPTPSKP